MKKFVDGDIIINAVGHKFRHERGALIPMDINWVDDFELYSSSMARKKSQPPISPFSEGVVSSMTRRVQLLTEAEEMILTGMAEEDMTEEEFREIYVKRRMESLKEREVVDPSAVQLISTVGIKMHKLVKF